MVWVGVGLRDECHILNLYDLFFSETELVFSVGRHRLALYGGKTKRVRRASDGGTGLLGQLLRIGKIVVLEIAVGVSIIVRGSAVVERI